MDAVTLANQISEGCSLSEKQHLLFLRGVFYLGADEEAEQAVEQSLPGEFHELQRELLGAPEVVSALEIFVERIEEASEPS